MSAMSPIYRTPEGKDVHGLLAEFADPGAITHAAEKVRDAGYSKWDVFSPFPVHGMEEAMGLKRPLLPLVVGCVGLTGAVVGFLFQYWVRVYGYNVVHQGKPAEAWQLLIPVSFEIGVLFTAFTCILGMLAFNGLPRFHHPLLGNKRFLKVSDDRFVIVIEAKDPKFDPARTRELLTAAGATAVELVEDA